MPKQPERTISRRWALAIALATCAAPSGCSLWRGKSDDESNEALTELMKAPPPPDLVREAAVAQGMHSIQIDGVGAISGLAGSGGPADPSVFRDQLIEEMKRHDVDDPNHFLESNDTALVRVRASIPPGARRGDPLDIRILAPDESQVTDLQGGWLLETRLRQQMAVRKQLMQSSIRQSEVMAIGTGPVLSRGAYTPGDDESLDIEGSIIAGGRIQADRKLALIMRPKYRHVALASAVSAAVNRRFFFFDGTTRRGIAKPMEDDFIQIEVHPRYRDNVPRLMAVIRAIGIEPESSDTQARLTQLASKLADPATSADAALQLEALGESAVPTLLEGIKSDNPELRFYAAESLAYLDRIEAIDPLEEAARDVAAFRAPALAALQGIKQTLAVDAMRRLMDQPSLETRYGAFCSIRRRSDARRSLGGQSLGSFWLYQIPTPAAPAVIASLRESPELVLFGDLGTIELPQFMRGPRGIIIRPEDGQTGKLRISRFQVGRDDQFAMVDHSVAGVIAGLASVGAGYGDVIECLRLAKESGYLSDQLAIDPLPAAMRTYYRDQDDAPEEAEDLDEVDS